MTGSYNGLIMASHYLLTHYWWGGASHALVSSCQETGLRFMPYMAVIMCVEVKKYGFVSWWWCLIVFLCFKTTPPTSWLWPDIDYNWLKWKLITIVVIVDSRFGDTMRCMDFSRPVACSSQCMRSAVEYSPKGAIPIKPEPKLSNFELIHWAPW